MEKTELSFINLLITGYKVKFNKSVGIRKSNLMSKSLFNVQKANLMSKQFCQIFCQNKKRR